MFHLERPLHFSPKIAGSICFMEWEGAFLLLKRSISSQQGGLWTAAPGGKVDLGETALQAGIREIREETGICREPDELTFIRTVYCQYPDIEYELHLFYTKLAHKPAITLDAKEHTEYTWQTLEQASTMPIMRGGHECIALMLDWLRKRHI